MFFKIIFQQTNSNYPMSDQTPSSPQARNIYANPYFNENNLKNTAQPVYYPKDTEK